MHETLIGYAERVERNLQALLRKDVIVRDIRQQWTRYPEATLPLLLIGWEEDIDGLWASVQALDQRFALQTFSANDTQDIRLLEASLDTISAWILEEVQPRLCTLYPSFRLCYGLLEGYWCIYALLPCNSWVPPIKLIQHTLFP